MSLQNRRLINFVFLTIIAPTLAIAATDHYFPAEPMFVGGSLLLLALVNGLSINFTCRGGGKKSQRTKYGRYEPTVAGWCGAMIVVVVAGLTISSQLPILTIWPIGAAVGLGAHLLHVPPIKRNLNFRHA